MMHMHVNSRADLMAWQKTGMTTEGGHQLHTSHCGLSAYHATQPHSYDAELDIHTQHQQHT